MEKLKDVREGLVKQVAEELGIDENLIDTIVSWQFKDAHEATKIYDTIEISGFGNFYPLQYKLIKRIKNTERMIGALEEIKGKETDEIILKNTTIKLSSCREALNFYRGKLKDNGFRKTVGRMAQQAIPS